MKLELLKTYGMSVPGDILPNVAKSIAVLLIDRGVAVVVKKKKKEKPDDDK